MLLKSRCFERARLQPPRKRSKIKVALATEEIFARQKQFLQHPL
jgi:hypothetical protein